MSQKKLFEEQERERVTVMLGMQAKTKQGRPGSSSVLSLYKQIIQCMCI